MQKLDFTENLQRITKSLKSEEILAFINDLPDGPQISTTALTPIIIESKSNYDKISPQDTELEILKVLDSETIYSDKAIGYLINTSVNITLQRQQKVHLFLQPDIMAFINLHSALVNSLKLSKHVLFKNNLPEVIDDNTIIFRILINNDLGVDKYSKILNLLSELIDVLQKVNNEEDIEPTITLLDSGSDTNLGIKTTIETARSLFQIFKEVWDWIVNRKFYQNKLRNAGLLDNLNVMISIKDALEKGAIDENTAKIYRETVIRRTEDLLELNVIPKSLIDTKTQESSRKLLNEYSETKLLER